MNANDVLLHAAQHSHEAAQALARVDDAAGMAGQQSAIDKFGPIATARALVSISQSLVVLATATVNPAEVLGLGMQQQSGPKVDPE